MKKKLNACLLGLAMTGCCALFLLLNCTQEKKFGQLPYTVLVRSYENSTEAQRAVKRLVDLKFNAFIVKRVNTAGDYTIDVCTGVYKTEQQAEKMKEKLTANGLAGAQVIFYDTMRGEIEEFNALPAGEQKDYTAAGSGEPDLPAAILDNLALFPADDNFRIATLRIEDCTYNLARITGREMLVFNAELLPPGISLVGIREKAATLIQAVYEDKLFGYAVAFLIAGTADTALLSDTMFKNKQLGSVKQDRLPYPATGSAFIGTLYERTVGEKQYTYCAIDNESGYVLVIDSVNCPQNIFLQLINQGAASLGLRSFPEVERNLSLLPRWDETDLLTFSGYSLEAVPDTFALERDNSDWARSVVGNFRSKGYYVTGKDCFTVAVFDLNFTKTAANVFNVFMINNQEIDNGEPQAARGQNGWYSDTPGFTELSFLHGSYVIALDYLTYQDWDAEFYYEIYKRFDAEKDLRLANMQKWAEKLPLND